LCAAVVVDGVRKPVTSRTAHKNGGTPLSWTLRADGDQHKGWRGSIMMGDGGGIS